MPRLRNAETDLDKVFAAFESLGFTVAIKPKPDRFEGADGSKWNAYDVMVRVSKPKTA